MTIVDNSVISTGDTDSGASASCRTAVSRFSRKRTTAGLNRLICVCLRLLRLCLDGFFFGIGVGVSLWVCKGIHHRRHEDSALPSRDMHSMAIARMLKYSKSDIIKNLRQTQDALCLVKSNRLWVSDTFAIG